MKTNNEIIVPLKKTNIPTGTGSFYSVIDWGKFDPFLQKNYPGFTRARVNFNDKKEHEIIKCLVKKPFSDNPDDLLYANFKYKSF